MEFSQQDIAKLVLGYLKEQKCHTAFSEFLNNSTYLKKHASSYRRGKFITTHVADLTLVNYLMEYAVLYSIVQARIEASEYYKEKGIRTSLEQKLLYLLNDGLDIQSRASTPIVHDSDITTECLLQQTTASKSMPITQSQSVQEGINSSYERSGADITASPRHSSLGSSSMDVSTLDSTKPKSKLNKSTSTEEDVTGKSQEMCEAEEILTQTFLENQELINKLTDSINIEVSAKSFSTEDPENFHIEKELDDAAIESITQRMAKDPVLLNLLEEIIGNEGGVNVNNTTTVENVQSACEETETRSILPVLLSTPKKVQDTCLQSIKNRLRSSKKFHSSPLKDVSSIEELNNEAVQSIVAASLSNEKQPPDQEFVSTATQNMSVREVHLSELRNNIVNTGTVAGTGSENQVYVSSVNTNNLLMVQPSGITAASSNIASTRSLQVESAKPYYVIGNQQFINMNVTSTPFKINTVLTEQDIMTMPTIILCENSQQSTGSQAIIVPTPASSTSSTHLRSIAPRTVDKAQSLSEYITLYQCNSHSPIISQPQLESSPQISRSNLKTISTSNTPKIKTRKKPVKECTQIQPQGETSSTVNLSNLSTNNSQISSEKVNSEDVASTSKTEPKPVSEQAQETKEDLKNKLLGESMPQVVTPKMKSFDIKERRSRSTPRNGSHIRQLDFSTPEKWCPVLRRATTTSPKMEKILNSKETPVKASKLGASKSIRTSLFKSLELDVPPVVVSDLPSVNGVKESQQDKVDSDPAGVFQISETDVIQSSKKVKSCKVNSSWDADLRALAAPVRTERRVTQKQKRKCSEESVKEHGSSKKIKENLNKTENDALKSETVLTGTEVDVENTETAASTNVSNVKTTVKRRDRITTKKAISVNTVVKNEDDKQLPLKLPQDTTDVSDNTCTSVEVSNVEEVATKGGNEQNLVEKQYEVINRNVKSRIKKKCNMENPVKKTPVPEEVILTNITKIKSCEILDEGKNKLILSPSKLNANKRTLVDVENRSVVVETSVPNKNTENVPENQETDGDKFITSELVKCSTNIPSTAAKRNIMPILETPVKFESIAFPKTPKLLSPPTVDTPFTKAVIDQLTEVDINTIPTPKFPITPNFPFTPAVRSEQSPFSNRTTDYSTSSSYYQPSDTDQNKSLEQLIEECRRLDTQAVAGPSKLKDRLVDDSQDVVTSCLTSNKNSEKPSNTETTRETEANSLFKPTQPVEVINKSVTDKMKAFNDSMIGKKNLQLVKMFSNETQKDESSSDSSSTGSDSNSSSSDDSESSDSSFTDSGAQTTAKNAAPYSLRPRKSLVKAPAVDVNVSKTSEKSQKLTVNEQPPEKVKKNPLTFHDGLLQEMEEKRQRTIARFKDANADKNTKGNPKLRKETPKAKENRNKTIKTPAASTSAKLLKAGTPKNANKSKKSVNTTKTAPAVTTNKSDTNVLCNQVKKQQLCTESSQKIKQVEFNVTAGTDEQSKPNKTSYISSKAHAMVDEDEIILHLSSDDELLEPFEMVETEMLDCSTSSTTVAEMEKLNEVLNTAVQPPIKTQENDETLDQQEESLVKGLKQWGIHLVRNKSKKKIVPPTEIAEQFGVQSRQNVVISVEQQSSCQIGNNPPHLQTKNIDKSKMTKKIIGKLEQSLKSNEKIEQQKSEISKGKVQHKVKSETSKKKIESKEKPRTSKEKIGNIEKLETSMEKMKKLVISLEKLESLESSVEKTRNLEKPGTSKEKVTETDVVDKANRSIEEGELVSDTEDNPKKESQSVKDKTNKLKNINSKTRSDSRRSSDSVKERKKYQDSRRDSSDLHRHRSHSEGKPRKPFADTSKNLSSKPSKSIDNKSSSNKPKLPTKPLQRVKETKFKNESIIPSTKQTTVSEIDYEVKFDTKTYVEETQRIAHDYSKKINRSMSDYNLSILTKRFSANVYIVEIDSEIEKFLSFTPFEMLLDIPGKPTVSQTRTADKSSNSQIQQKQKKTPLNILYNELIKPANETHRPSPLHDLYTSESTSKDYKSNEEHQNKIVDRSRKSEKSSKSKQKSVKENSLKAQVHNKNLEQNKKQSGLEQKDGNMVEEQKQLSPGNTNTSKLIESNLSVNKEGRKSLQHDLTVVDGVIMLNSNVEEEKKKTIEEGGYEVNDDLMNYALIGSERIPENEYSYIADSRKRRISEEEGEKHPEKKQKTEVCQELLRNIDVDSFLKKLHGET